MEKNEKKTNNAPLPVSISEMKEIIQQMEKSICKITNNNNSCTGFFCSIPYNKKNWKF